MLVATTTISVYDLKIKQEILSSTTTLQELDSKLIGSQLIEVSSVWIKSLLLYLLTIHLNWLRTLSTPC